MKTEKLYDVVAVNIETSIVSSLMAADKTLPNAEAIVSMAVMRRGGVGEEFFVEVPAGKYKAGDKYEN